MRYLKKIQNTFLVTILLFIVSIPATAGEIDFKDFRLIGYPAKYQVLTRIEFKLDDYLHQALLNGVDLKARVQFRLREHQDWWFDKDHPLLTVTYHLKYHALSRHYLLTRNDTNEHWNFTTFPSAIRKLGELRKYDLPVIKVPLKSGDYSLFVIADMIPATLRLPLRVQSFFSDKFKLTSKGVLWPLP